MIPAVAVDWSQWREWVRMSESGCWADGPGGKECGLLPSSDIGLCARHLDEKRAQ